MKKEELKAVIKENFENNEFAIAMGLNGKLLEEYEQVAGKRSASALVGYYRKKAESEEPVVTDIIDMPNEKSEIKLGDLISAEVEQEEVKEEPKPYRFTIGEEFSLNEISALLDSVNPTLQDYCIIKMYFHQVSDTERITKTEMYVKADGYGWSHYISVVEKLGGKKGQTIRRAGNLLNSSCGLPVGEEITSLLIYRIGDALQKFAFRDNESRLSCVNVY